MCGCMVSRNSPPSAWARSNSRRKMSSTAGGGVIQDSASSSTLTVLLAARERASGGAVNEHGAGHGSPRQRLTVYTSRHAHSSIEKAVKIAGLGRGNLRLVDADGHVLSNNTYLYTLTAENGESQARVKDKLIVYR